SLPIPEIDIEEIIQATAGQCYMLDMWSASSGRLFYPTFWLKVSGCSRKVFEQALKKLVSGSPVLRTLFVHHEGSEGPEIWQVVLNEEAVDKHELPWSAHVED